MEQRQGVSEEALTNEEFWDEFWAGITLPALIDTRVQWQFALTRLFQRVLPRGNSIESFEVGCVPGRWMVWFNKEMEYFVSGCDSSAKGIQLTLDNLRMNAVDGKVYQADLLGEELPEHSFDVVMSIGVIEHFDDPSAIIARHVNLVKPGGTLVLEVPNMAGWLNHKLLRAAGMQDLVSVHNLRVMHRSYFESIARDFGLGVKFCDYIGGFDPGMIVSNHDSRKHGRRPIMYPLWVMEHILRMFPRIHRFLGNFNSPAVSNMLVGVFSVPARAASSINFQAAVVS